MSNVKSLPNAHTPLNEPVEAVIKMLEDFLAQAKAGEIRSLAIAAVGFNNNGITAYYTEHQTFTLIGSTQYLVGRMVNVCDSPD